MVVKTFRGLMSAAGTAGSQERIRLSTIKGKVGYRLTKFQLLVEEPGAESIEGVMKIYKSSQSTLNGVVNFSDSDLLAAGFYENNTSDSTLGQSSTIIFDQEIFNQDIYVTYDDVSDSDSNCNYYFELEVIPLDDAGAEYTTLKDMRQ